jgi:hypothetical protein
MSDARATLAGLHSGDYGTRALDRRQAPAYGVPGDT